MKWLLIFLIGAFTIVQINAQDAYLIQGPAITWELLSHDFGDIVQGDKVDYTFKFTNTGDQPLVLTNVEVTCGCTTPKGWPRDPIIPGGKGELTVAFNSAGKFGRQNKVVTVTSNSVGSTNQVMITANVIEKGNPD
ncbi:MAG: DUF1573 domain-containing protein [Flammeovirgaceae bacterium]|jgi:hypothetical protein|nr:DUF1573 domain-containing protein [Flammeovirgaceae bacterium]